VRERAPKSLPVFKGEQAFAPSIIRSAAQPCCACVRHSQGVSGGNPDRLEGQSLYLGRPSLVNEDVFFEPVNGGIVGLPRLGSEGLSG
jgi:hypothetical protein